MKCERCRSELGKDVTMEDLGAGQFQCPDCRACVVPAPPVAVVETVVDAPLTCGAGLESEDGPDLVDGESASPEASPEDNA